MVEKTKKVWMDGQLIDWDSANVHVLTHALHYGTSVFEGIRCYKKNDGSRNIFRLREHIERLLRSAKMMLIPVSYNIAELEKAVNDLVDVNKLDECYIRPIIFLGAGPMGLDSRKSPVNVAIIAWRWNSYLGDCSDGIKVILSPYRRQKSEFSTVKICGSYYLSILAKRFAVDKGFDETIMLDSDGFVAEGSSENIFIIKNKVVSTPKVGAILPGITRKEVIGISRKLGYKTHEKNITVEELNAADEIFFTGTAAEVTAVVKIDKQLVGDGKVGTVTCKIRDAFFEGVRG